MAQLVLSEKSRGVAILRLNLPPMNPLTEGMRSALGEALADAASAPDIKAVVLVGQGVNFSVGLDLRELDRPAAYPLLTDICQTIEDFAKPVVACLHGMALGGGLELALACHGRVAQTHCMIGFPDIAMGLPPSAGGTQRLPRLLGAGAALDMLLEGRTRPARGDALAPMFDKIADQDAEEAALDLALDLADKGQVPTSERRDGFAEGAAYQAEIHARREALRRDSLTEVAERVIDCVEAAQLLPIGAGLEFEAAAFADCRDSDQAKALRHAYFAERRSANMPELAQEKPRDVRVLGLVGGGPAAVGAALCTLAAGREVILFERSAEAIAAARQRIEAALDHAVTSRRMTDKRRLAQLARLQFTEGLSDLSRADLILEAVADNPATKAQVFAALDKVAAPQAVLASHSLILPIDPMADAVADPGRVIGMHLHMPAQANHLAELICGPRNSAQTIATAAHFLSELNKFAVRVGGGHGGLGERIMAALRDACCGMVLRGTAPARIDAALRDYGFAMGPLQQMDMIGLDTCLARGRAMAAAPGFATGHLAVLEALVGAGRLGTKAGGGFLSWPDGKGVAEADPAVMALLGAGGKPLKDGEILLRAVAAMANAGARALRAERALRPSDIDTVMIHAYHYPRWRGGPMKAADLLGVFETGQALRHLAQEDEALYTPDPGFAALARNHETFDALNRIGRNRRRIPG